MADILIRGMEMPDGCHHCRFSYLYEGETNDGEPCTVIMCSAMEQGTNGAEYDGNRPFWCPLVPLPEGHGDLIDRDNVLLDIDCTGTNKFGMPEEEELFAAVRLISKHCSLRGDDCSDCPLLHWCEINDAAGLSAVPDEWPDPEEGDDNE